VIDGRLPSFRQLLNAMPIPGWLLGGEELSAGLFNLLVVLEPPSTQEMSHRPE